MKKIVAGLLVLMLVFAGTAFAAEDGGSFVLAVFTANKTVIEPTRIPYRSGQTVREALLETEHEFVGLEQGFIYAVDGNSAGYTLFYDKGGYDLNVDAAEISTLCIGVGVDYAADTIALLNGMMDYREAQNNANNYPAAIAAYQNALAGIRKNEPAASLKDALNAAVAEYEALLAGPKYTVSLAVTQGTATGFTLTDAYGNVTAATGTTAQVIAGEYSFVVSDGGYNRTEGKLSVSGDTTLSVALPTGEWFGTVRLLNKAKNPFPSVIDADAHTAQFSVEDTAGEIGSVYLNVDMGAVPDEKTTKLRSIYIGTDGLDKSGTPRSWESLNSALTYLLKQGTEGRAFTIEGQYLDTNGHTQIQSYAMRVDRVPTLSALTVTAEGTVLPLELAVGKYSYDVTTVADTLAISAEVFAEDYTVTGTGDVSAASSPHTVTVTAPNGAVSNYTIKITQKQAVNVTLNVPAGVTAQVFNTAGSEIAPVGGKYRLVPGEEYSYLATKNTYFHTTKTFVAAEGLTVNVATPDATDGLSALKLYSAKTAEARIEYEGETAFRAAQHTYTYPVSDCNSSLYLQATAAGYSVTAHYTTQHRGNAQLHGVKKEITVPYPVSDMEYAQNLTNALAKSGYAQRATVRLSKTAGGVTYYQDYDLHLVRELHLSDFSATAAGEQLDLMDAAGNVTEFDRDIREYDICINRDTEELSFAGEFPNMGSDTDICGGYSVSVNGGAAVEEFPAIALDTEQYEETLTLKVMHADETSCAGEYVIHITKTDPVKITAATTPAEAVVYLENKANGKRVYDENGVFALTPGATYAYTVTCAGYVGKSGTYTAPETDGVFSLTLEQAPANAALKQLDAAWPSFRADADNNGVVSAKMPVQDEEAVLYWATKIGSGYDSNACGCPIIVDGYLYTYAGTTLYKVDTQTGAIVKTGKMHHASSFAINPPTYADGMIFVGLADGTVQAFNATTLDSLWIYQDELKGQPNCPITYHNGYIYTGFWIGETNDAHFVCLNATDENPASTEEAKLATWKHTARGGFYWAGCYVCDDYLLVGTDDGVSGYTDGRSSVLSLDPETGRVIDTMQMPVAGDIRNTIMRDNGKYYFTNKGGYFFELTVGRDGKLGELRTLKLYNYASDENTPAMSTCTPTIYNGRAYIGVSGTSQYGAYSGHNITVIDIANWELAYTVRTQGYPQTSGILTTAYEKSTGSVYVYFFDNFTPGKLRILQDKPGQTSASMVSVEQYTNKGTTVTYETAYNIFEPFGEHAQYAICSPVVDEYGTLYFKNDSAYLMAVGSAVTELKVTQEPDKTAYAVGEYFDRTGMRVTAQYANGLERDVTQYVTWSEEKLTAVDTDFAIELPYALYQNADGAAGVAYDQPFATVALQIDGMVIYGDVNGDGKVTAVDAAMTYAIANARLKPTDAQRNAADVNDDGKVTAVDAAMVYAKANRRLAQFPVEK